MQCYDTMQPIHAGGTAVALGYFDGVHLGHRSVLRAAQDMAAAHGLAAAAFTFTLPENGGMKGRAILTQSEKRRRMQAAGVQHYFCPPFADFFALTPVQFVDEILLHCLGARHVFCGDNFTFGAQKSGDVSLLHRLCEARGIGVHVVPMALYGGEPVSSSRIRTALADGDFTAVNAMLGEKYRVDFPVQHGAHFDRTLGFPTIHQSYPPSMLLPKSGVYLTRTLAQGVWRPGATGIGTHPTVGGEGITCETFLGDYTGELYGEAVQVEFCADWMPTVKFASAEELQASLADAAKAALAYFA
ncbi:MAG: riboflavin kinase [Ruthenibacterium sp.]